MDIKYGSPEAKTFITNLSLITSKGKWGDNIMTAEWVHHVSYEPGLVMVNVHDFDATAENILDSKEFGISIVAEEIAEIITIAGRHSGKEVDKIAVLRDLGFKFYGGKRVGVQMVSGAALNIECKLLKHEKVGDHMMFIGEVVDATINPDKTSLAFRAASGIYKLENSLPHTRDEEREKKIAELIEKHKRPKS